MASNRTLYIDQRWRGTHGIARYSSEVLSRLSVVSLPLRAPGDPGSPLDLLLPRVVGVNSRVYSPGYNAGITRARQLVTVHDLIHLQTTNAKYRHYYQQILRPTVRRAGMVLTVSETSKSELRDWLDDESVEIVNAGNGVSPAFRPDPVRDSAQPDYVLFVGNLKEHKNFDVLLRALGRTTDLQLVAVVPDPEAATAAADQRGVGGRVSALSHLTDDHLRKLYSGAAATIVPSTLEGFGLPAAESLCCGTPVVHWAGCASVAEIVGHHGWSLSSATDPDEWANALSMATSAPIAVDPDITRERYNWDRVGTVVEQTIQRFSS